MAIIIPKDNIFNYNFNILNNNSIKNVSISYDNYLNWKATNVTMDRGGTPVENFPTLFYSSDSKLVFPTTPNTSDNTSMKRQDITFSEGTRLETKRSFNIKGYISYANEFIALDYQIENYIDSVTDTIVYSTQDQESGEWTYGHTKTLDFNINYRDVVPSNIRYLPEQIFEQDCYITFAKTQGNRSFPSIDFFISVPNEAWRWESYNQGYHDIIASHNITINFVPHYKTRRVKINNNKEIFSLSKTNFLNDYIFSEGNMLLSNIMDNIINNYNKGKMTLEIETRYTTFKDTNGNYINNGKPYLIKVGDVVKPEMTNKFKNFQYEYLVTSAEYEYNGSDKLYLKLLQIN